MQFETTKATKVLYSAVQASAFMKEDNRGAGQTLGVPNNQANSI